METDVLIGNIVDLSAGSQNDGTGDGPKVLFTIPQSSGCGVIGTPRLVLGMRDDSVTGEHGLDQVF
ncbi:hypothetical protein KKF61_00415 [Patescibacteria group bacterium]|nr:hypothetical protein [Patescibacteria group bacterium]MBU0963929.1 hypothetical protein [Patescibacteria group bacterium]